MVVANNSNQKGSSTTVIRRSSQAKNRINGNTSGAPSNNDVGTAVVAISPRKSEFSKSTWWMVDLNNQSIISNRQGATPLVARCQREYLWDEAKCRRVLNAYRQFLELKKIFEDWDATVLSPSQVVDQMWHQHLLDVTNYCHDTILLCGHVVGHNPDGALDGPAKAARTKTTRDALFENFGSDYNKEMWLTPTELHEEERIDSKIPITLILRDKTGKKQLFKIKRHQKLSVLFKSYAQMTGVAVHELHFLFDGERIGKSDTSFDLELNDQDEIDVMLKERIDRKTPITLILRDQTGRKFWLKLKLHQKLSGLFSTYVKMTGVAVHDIRFLFGGERISESDTPFDLELNDQDQIDVMLEGSGC